MDNRPDDCYSPFSNGDKQTGTGAPVPKAMSGRGVCAVVCGLLSYLFPLTALFGIGAAVSGILRDRRDWLSYAGLILSLIMLIVNTVQMIDACGSGELSALLGSGVSGSDF